MSEDDFDAFAEQLDGVSELRQLPFLTAKAKTLFFKAVKRYPIGMVQRAIEAHLLDPEAGKFKTQIQPAHIVAQIEMAAANDGRPSADEAWGTALLASDENATIVWTQEIAQALAAAQPVLDAGDRVGARMAFKNAYDRLVTEARQELRPVRWQPSFGLDPTQREMGLKKAANAGLLPAPTVAALLPPPADVGGARDDEAADQNIKKLAAMLAGGRSPHEKTRRAYNETANTAARERLDLLKARSQALVGQPAVPLWPCADLNESPGERV